MKIYDAMTADNEKVVFRNSEGKTAADYIYAYPPDIPIVVPGEEITEEIIKKIEDMIEQGITIIGVENGLFSCVKDS